ncbi:unnamed protein product [Staurois parvus]|uniref:Uncharacterized protein n=1 Tax=Staurois parvus TaxID=386267 RepID=A0ABN9HDI9_9NEOB|nr:unnamed protein product [Staurois parvus]
MADMGPGGTNGRPVICQQPMNKMENRRSVRRFQSGTWQSGKQWEAVQGPRSHCGLSSSMTRRYGGPWPIWGLAAPMEGL